VPALPGVSVPRTGADSHHEGVSGAPRVAVIGPIPPPAGGMANQTEQLARLWQGEGLEAHLIPANAPYRPAWVRHLWGVRAVCRLIPYLLALWRAAAGVSLFHVMANSGLSWFLFAVPPLLVGRLRGVPVVVNYRGGRAPEFLAGMGVLAKPLMRLAHRLVVPSGFLEEVFRKHGLPVVVIPNIIDLDRFMWREPAGAPPARPHVIVARNLERIYDVATAIRAFSRVRHRLPRARLTIAGSGPEHASLRAMVDEMGLVDAVRFTGPLDGTEMAALYSEADVMLNTSRVDNMPNAILEALACGVPVVSTAAGGIPYMVRDGETALLVHPADPDAASQAVCRVLGDRMLARRLSVCGRAEVERYAWPAVKIQWAALYREVLEGCNEQRA
jgi:glycosyltransferase involved in cell wall biosynthesis